MDALTPSQTIKMLDRMSPPHPTSSIATTITAAVVAVTLVAGVVALALMNPCALIALPPVLLAVAAIVHAVTGTRPNTR